MTAPPRPNLRLTLPLLMTRAEVAALLGIHPDSVKRLDYRLRPIRTLGGQRRFRRDAVVDAYEAAQSRRTR